MNARVLAGFAHGSSVRLPLREAIIFPPPLIGPERPPLTEFSFPGETRFAASAGGSIDYRITGRLSYRIIQPELLLTRFSSSTLQPNLRVSTGVIVNLGRR